MTRIVCLGIVTVDRIWHLAEIPARPVKVQADDFRETGGGMAATAAVAIAALGGQAELWSRVGDDANGNWLRHQLAARGVGTDGVRVFPGAVTPCSAAMVDAQGERLLSYFRGRGLGDDPGWLPVASLDGAAAVMADVRWGAGAIRLFEEAKRRGILSVLDADVGEPDRMKALARLADHVVFSAAGLARLAGAEGKEGLRRAARETNGVVGVTAGADGYMWLEQGGLRRAPGFKVAARDTTGAGDVFHGAYALAIAEGRALDHAARFANAAAALKCAAGHGWNGMPSREEVEALVATDGYAASSFDRLRTRP